MAKAQLCASARRILSAEAEYDRIRLDTVRRVEEMRAADSRLQQAQADDDRMWSSAFKFGLVAESDKKNIFKKAAGAA
jgi:hypothetical protein